MINLQGLDMEAMVKGLNTVTKEAEKLVSSTMSDDITELMTDDQKNQMRDARKNLNAIKSMDLTKMSDVLKKFKK